MDLARGRTEAFGGYAGRSDSGSDGAAAQMHDATVARYIGIATKKLAIYITTKTVAQLAMRRDQGEAPRGNVEFIRADCIAVSSRNTKTEHSDLVTDIQVASGASERDDQHFCGIPRFSERVSTSKHKVARR